jgi:hypothetical protein
LVGKIAVVLDGEDEREIADFKGVVTDGRAYITELDL